MDKDAILKEIKDLCPNYEKKYNSLTSDGAKASHVNDAVTLWRTARAFLGDDISAYGADLDNLFLPIEDVKPTSVDNLINAIGDRLKWITAEMYPIASNEVLKKHVAGMVVLAGQLKRNPLIIKETIYSLRGLLTQEFALYLHNINGKFTNMKKRDEALAAAGNNELIDVTVQYLEKFMSGYSPVGLQKRLDDIAEAEIGNDYEVFRRLLTRQQEIIKSLDSGSREAVSALTVLKASELERIVSDLEQHKYDNIKNDFWKVRSMYQLREPVKKSFVAVPVFLSAVGSRPIIIGVFIVLAIVVIGVAIYFIVRAVKKKGEKMTIIPRSTLRTLNPYNQTFFV